MANDGTEVLPRYNLVHLHKNALRPIGRLVLPRYKLVHLY